MKFESRSEFRCLWKILSVAQQLRKGSHWCFYSTWRNFTWKQHIVICLEKGNHSFASKANVGLVIVLLNLIFLPSQWVSWAVCYISFSLLWWEAFLERGQSTLHSLTHFYSCSGSKDMESLDTSLPVNAVAQATGSCLLRILCQKWWSQSLVITDALIPSTLQRQDDMGFCFLSDNILITLTLLHVYMLFNSFPSCPPPLLFSPTYFTIT